MSKQSTALATVQSSDASTPGDFGDEHRRVVRDAFAPTATEAEFNVLWMGAKSRGLDPVKRQIHFVKRRDNTRNAEVWSSQTSIDGFRAIAEDTGKYDGQDEAEYELHPESGGVTGARVRVYRKDISRAFVGYAKWDEFVQLKDNAPSHMWQKMPFHMLAKCAEALALRKAFPEQLSGLYTNDEMGSDEAQSSPAPRVVDLTPRAAPATHLATGHVVVPGVATFAACSAEGLLDLLQTTRECDQGEDGERAFADRMAVLLAAATGEQYRTLLTVANGSALVCNSPPHVTVKRAIDVARARLTSTPAGAQS